MSKPISRVICLLDFLAPTPIPSSRPSIPPCVVRPGELVYVQVLSRITIEGHSCQADASYWHDPDLSGDYWMTKRRPAIVLQTWLKEKKYYVIKVIPIKLGSRALGGSSVIRLTNKESATDACSVPGWPLDDAFCYVFPHPESFASVPKVFPFILQSFLSCLIYLSGSASTRTLENETKRLQIALGHISLRASPFVRQRFEQL
jgi:hypothetical protein